MKRIKTKKSYENLCEILPGGVNSPVRSGSHVGVLPLVVSHASKDKLFDVDGKDYIDFCQSWGALIHGHAHPKILRAIQRQIALGTTYGTTTKIEGVLGRKIQEFIPSIEKIRFVSSGTESTMSAIRLCRGYTKKNLIIKFDGNYHGHADFFLVKAGSGVFDLPESSSSGIPEDFVKWTLSLPFNDIEAFKKAIQDPKVKENLAAVIIEPIAGNIGVVPARQEFLQFLREETKKLNALLVFDEVITGFRVSLGGAQQIYGITPDLTCLGKIIGGGFPAAAFGGKKEIMDCLSPLGSVYQAGTLSGNPVAMEAGLKALELLNEKVYQDLEEKTLSLVLPIKEYIKKKDYLACIQHQGSMFTIFFGRKEVNNLEEAKQLDFKKFAKFFSFLLENKIYFPPAQQEAAFISTVHSKRHLERARDTILKFLNDN